MPMFYNLPNDEFYIEINKLSFISQIIISLSKNN